ncbi:hypothetical protein IC582_013050 [Cucumis melo]
MAIALALHPIPERLKLLMSFLIEYLLMTMDDREGEGQKPLQLTIRISMSEGERWVLVKRSSMTGNSTIWTSLMDSCRWVLGGMKCRAGGRQVCSLCPEDMRVLAMKLILSLSKISIKVAFSRKVEKGTLKKLGGLRHEKSTKYTELGEARLKMMETTRKDSGKIWKKGCHACEKYR